MQFKRKIGVLMVLSALSFNLFANSEIHRWIDAEGRVHFGDYPKQGTTSEKVTIKNSNTMQALMPQKKEPVLEDNETDSTLYGVQDTSSTKTVDCEAGEQKYLNLTHLKHKGYGFTATVIRKDGKVISRREQNALAENFRMRLNALGCSINRSPYIKDD